jgi:hypothetical protein
MRFSRRIGFRCIAAWLAGGVLALWALQAFAVPVVVYATQFEPAEGFDLNFDLAGQKGWTNAGLGGNGLLQGYSGYGQSAYIGYWPPATYSGFYLWHPNKPAFTNYPLLTFTVDMALVDSTNAFRDVFLWTAYNTAGNALFSLSFFSSNPGQWDIYYMQDSDTVYRGTGWQIASSNIFNVRMTMNFPSNRWDAWVGARQVVTNALVTGTNAPKNLGDMDAVWLPDSHAGTGNNFMIFDNYTISGEVPKLDPPVFIAGGQHRIRANGPNGLRYSLDVSTNLATWAPLRTNLITGGFADYTNANAGRVQQHYRARWVP